MLIYFPKHSREYFNKVSYYYAEKPLSFKEWEKKEASISFSPKSKVWVLHYVSTNFKTYNRIYPGIRLKHSKMLTHTWYSQCL